MLTPFLSTTSTTSIISIASNNSVNENKVTAEEVIFNMYQIASAPENQTPQEISCALINQITTNFAVLNHQEDGNSFHMAEPLQEGMVILSVNDNGDEIITSCNVLNMLNNVWLNSTGDTQTALENFQKSNPADLLTKGVELYNEKMQKNIVIEREEFEEFDEPKIPNEMLMKLIKNLTFKDAIAFSLTDKRHNAVYEAVCKERLVSDYEVQLTKTRMFSFEKMSAQEVYAKLSFYRRDPFRTLGQRGLGHFAMQGSKYGLRGFGGPNTSRRMQEGTLTFQDAIDSAIEDTKNNNLFVWQPHPYISDMLLRKYAVDRSLTQVVWGTFSWYKLDRLMTEPMINYIDSGELTLPEALELTEYEHQLLLDKKFRDEIIDGWFTMKEFFRLKETIQIKEEEKDLKIEQISRSLEEQFTSGLITRNQYGISILESKKQVEKSFCNEIFSLFKKGSAEVIVELEGK